MRRVDAQVFGLVLLTVSIVYVGAALAQTLTATTPPPPAQASWEILLKSAFGLVMVVAAPYIQGFVTQSFAKVPPTVQYVISGLAGLVLGGFAGQIPDLPITSETAANIGLSSSLAGQFLANRSRSDMHPKTEAAQVILAKLPKDEREGLA